MSRQTPLSRQAQASRRFRLSGRLRALAGAVVVLLVAGCGGIPESSAPQVVRTVERGPTSITAEPRATPQPGDGPSDVVKKFVQAGTDADAGHSTSRQFLTTATARRWQDNPTVILDETNIGDATLSGDSATVPVTGRRVGQIDANGVFSPILKGTGTGDEETFNFNLAKISGYWRMDQLQPGVLISEPAFSSAFRQRELYFFDATRPVLVPDLRYTPLLGQALAGWLLTELLAGPRPELAQNLVSEVPTQAGKPSAQVGDPLTVEIPGAAQLDAGGRNGLAAIDPAR